MPLHKRRRPVTEPGAPITDHADANRMVSCILPPPGDRRAARDARRRAAAVELEDLAPLAVFYSGAYRYPLLYGPEAAGARRCA